MSYILEALKRSQKDRELGSVPTLQTEHYTHPKETKNKSALWIIVAVALAFLAVLIAIYGVFYKAPTTTVAATPVKQQQPEPPVNIKSETQQPIAKKKPPAIKKKKPIVVAKTLTKPPVSEKNEQLADMKKRYQEMIKEQQIVLPAVPEKAIEPVVLPKHLPTVQELPEHLKEKIPRLNILMYYYDIQPDQRFVILNSNKMQEGERTIEGIMIKEIRENGLLLSIEGEVFFHKR